MRCPNHPGGGCALARHGTYARKTPPGKRIARWYCPESHTSFSLLPDCLAARLPGILAELEEAAAAAERSPTVTAAATVLRPGRSEPPGAMRWLRRVSVRNYVCEPPLAERDPIRRLLFMRKPDIAGG